MLAGDAIDLLLKPTRQRPTTMPPGESRAYNTDNTLASITVSHSSLPSTAYSLSWDFENKLIAADTDNDSMDDMFYKFDALGRRVGRNDGTANVVYFQDGQQTIADYPSGTAAGSPTYTYVYASYIDEPVMRGGSGGLRYYHHNQQYSITTVSDGGGSVVERYAYSAYGQVTIFDDSGSQISNSEISNRYTYTGREWDEGLSLYHYRARMYDAVGGRFVSRDPIGFRSHDFNSYRYCRGRSLVAVDFSGLEDWILGPRGEEWCVDLNERDGYPGFGTQGVPGTSYVIKVQFRPAPQDYKDPCCAASMTRITCAYSYPVVVTANQHNVATTINGVPWSIYVDPLVPNPSFFPGVDPPSPVFNYPGSNAPYGPDSVPDTPPWIEVGGTVHIPENRFIRNPPPDRLYVFAALGEDCKGRYYNLGFIVVRVQITADPNSPPFSNVNIGVRPSTISNNTFIQCWNHAVSPMRD